MHCVLWLSHFLEYVRRVSLILLTKVMEALKSVKGKSNRVLWNRNEDPPWGVETSEREEQLRSQSLEPKRRPRTDKDGQSTHSGVGATTTATTYYPLWPIQKGRYSKSNLSNQTYQTKLTTLNILNQTFLGWVHYCYFLPTTGDYKSSTFVS